MSDFSDKVWWTKKARIKTEVRLLNLHFYSQFFLLWYSIFLVCYSIYTLVLPVGTITQTESATMVALSVLVLVATLFINNMDFKGRALLVKQCYEQLSIIYTKSCVENPDKPRLDSDYQNVLAISENHQEKDFYLAVVDEYNNASDKSKLSKTPTDKMRCKVNFVKARNVISILFLFFFPLLTVVLLRIA
ncbi:SLATT domain-containing protein [Cronobacter sakazakii]|uniref:SLATT domain-containing protein n=1 Tax=Cronobacter sakazakii TaxID=28141 RepID=UPI0006ACF0F5|nr:SLATT domain-containing protein [Cronobacter sakazakii]EGT4304321.1 SLATT domain-containing protein [Cronobacter sakazakii]EGT4325052.1 SLATT domain-containing protein [Cronobacter sakazakii]EGT4362713.1 SLATT domain-containing protein [Cronobacter sakazakii]MDK1190171.1 SLATT domain-containing protein [Cronobacter sakazakii]MDT3640626.1 SLATT domain-containing protein [Cronobacter sakazakii]